MPTRKPRRIVTTRATFTSRIRGAAPTICDVPTNYGGLWPTEVAGAELLRDRPLTDDELRDAYRSQLDAAAPIPGAFTMAERERWNGATVVPIRGRGNDEGSTGMARLANGTRVDLERAADAWLLAADLPTMRPDRVAETVDPFTLLDRVDRQNVKPDRVAYLGAGHARVITHRRANVKSHPKTNGDRTVCTITKREACDVTYVERAIFAPSAAFMVDQHGTTYQVRTINEHGHQVITLPMPATTELRPITLQSIERRTVTTIPWQTTWQTSTRQQNRNGTATRAKRASKIAAKSAQNPQSLAAVTSSALTSDQVRSAPLPNLPGIAAQTAVYGRPVTAWTCSPRSLPRILARADDATRSLASALYTVIHATTRDDYPADLVALVDACTIVGDLVDDGTHGAMSARIWSQRMAVAMQ
jgi:hypothetical protein